MSESVTAPGDHAIEARGLAVRYGRSTVLRDLDLTVPRGAVYALLGRNGAGKSSLLRCLLGLQRPDAGSVRVFGRDTWVHRAEVLASVGVVPEEPDAPPEMTVPQLVRLCAGLHGARWDGPAVEDRLGRFEIPWGTRFGRLSKGQKGAVMLSLALGHRPELLVLDDPTLGLDAIARDAVFGEVIGDLADHGTTVFLTTHDLLAIEGLADRVGFLVGGRLVIEEELEALKAHWGCPLEEIFTAVAGRRGAA